MTKIADELRWKKRGKEFFYRKKLSDGRQKQLIRVKCRSNATLAKQENSYHQAAATRHDNNAVLAIFKGYPTIIWLEMLISLFLLIFLVISAAEAVKVEISTGALTGYQVRASSGKLVNIFKHIPYAAPPIGELRFQKPCPPKNWSGLRDATEYGPACMSNSSTTKSPQKWVDEDCLHVNIFAGEDCLKTSCPVVFYIHGGGFNYDSAVMFKDKFLVNNFGGKGVVLVVPGFRLGFFGLLTFASDEVVPRNIGAYDLLAALKFVKDEIKNFGGNLDDVTLFGHSGGAAAAAQFAFSKRIDPEKKLFQKAVMMSMQFGFSKVTHMQDLTMDLAYRAKCVPSRTPKYNSTAFVRGVVRCLRDVDSMEILRIQREMEDESEYRKPEGLVMTPPLFVAQDLQEFFRDPPRRSIVTGTTSEELDTSDDPLGESVAELLGIKNSEEVLKRYHEDLTSDKLPFNHSASTQQIFLSSYVIGHALRKAGGKAYLYSYSNPRHPVHTDDLSYIMGVHEFEHDANEAVLAVLYPRFFVDFVKTGRPRRDWTPLQAGLDNYMDINVDVDNGTMPHMALHYESEVINYWEGLIDYDQQITSLKRAVAETRAMDVSAVVNAGATSDDNSTIIELFLPLFAVVITVIIVGLLVRRREMQKQSFKDRSEKMPLFS
ncbi:hypothetical protein Y032_0071g623 [Ancylostoma ceylanicum]|uniref:Carboxylic ester hydrolase n=1 Tax=Ancylostoma ceylanicum TaxID=53326 RepID=A0A016TX71_9BILA|nr:hypothetical protein Y032_0071g623 [Ancylostoma ceylanicum]